MAAPSMGSRAEVGLDDEGAKRRNIEVVEERPRHEKRQNGRSPPAEVRGDHHRGNEEGRRKGSVGDRSIGKERRPHGEEREAPPHEERQVRIVSGVLSGEPRSCSPVL